MVGLCALGGCGDEVSSVSSGDTSSTVTTEAETSEDGSSTALEACVNAIGCPQDEVCVDGVCQAPGPCDNSADCRGGSSCEAGECGGVAVVPACPRAASLTPILSANHFGDAFPTLGAFDHDGLGARELILGLQDAVAVVSPSGELSVLAEVPGATAFAVHDFDDDGREDLLIGSDRIHSWQGATGELLDNFSPGRRSAILGLVPNAALWACPQGEQCEGAVETLLLQDGPNGVGDRDSIALGAGGLAYGNVLGSPQPEFIADRYHRVTVGANQYTFEDDAVSGTGAITTADLDGLGYLEVVRLWGGPDGSTATILSSDGERLSVSTRRGLPPDLGTIAAGDFDGDGLDELVAGGPLGFVVWTGAFRPDGGCIQPLDFNVEIGPVLVADVVGTGRANVVVTSSASTTVYHLD